jgi:hypothetical protein
MIQDIQKKIELARKKGYSDEQIKTFLSSKGENPNVVVKTPSFTESIAQDYNQRADKVGTILSRPVASITKNPVQSVIDVATKGVQAIGQGAGGVANIIEKGVEKIPGVKPVLEKVGEGMNWVATSELSPVKHLGDILGESKTLQEVTNLYDTDSEFKDTIDGVANLARLGMDVQGVLESGAYAKNVTNKIVSKLKTDVPKIPPEGGTGGLVKNIKKDILPTTERFVNTEVTKALDLTQGDVKNISLSTGNDVGEFIANKNLIGNTVEETTKKLDDFYKANYEQVRSEIGKVTKIYDKNQIPAYQEALGEIKKQVADKIGLTEVEAEVDTLLRKKKLTLNDVQRAKELMDEHFSLYKMTGDVKEGVVKEGLVNIRKELRSFIETRVKKETGVDIKPMNNNVMTARSINEAIAERSTRGLTRATISASDLIVFLTGSGFTPVGGAIALLIKKIYQSPAFKLRLVKYLDSLTDSKRLEIKQSLEKGIVPEELQTAPSNNLSSEAKTPQTDLTKNESK